MTKPAGVRLMRRAGKRPCSPHVPVLLGMRTAAGKRTGGAAHEENMDAGRQLSILCLSVAAVMPCLGGGRWWTYESCRLIPNKANDGDSFHVRTKSAHLIFRLYFADAPETDTSFPERIREQAEHWGIRAKDVPDLGARAARFTERFLRDGFTVYSKRDDARGRSRRDRFFAMVKVNDQWLSEALVQEGLARVYGAVPSEMPDGGSPRKFSADLRVAERSAKREGKGGWDMKRRPGREGPDRIERRELILDRPVSVYSLGEAPRYLARLPQGTRVTVLGRESRFMARIRFESSGDRLEGKCRVRDLDLESSPLPKRSGEIEEQEVLLDRPVSVYSLGSVPRYLARLPEGTRVTVLGRESTSMARIRYKSDGASVEGRCRIRDLPLKKKRRDATRSPSG